LVRFCLYHQNLKTFFLRLVSSYQLSWHKKAPAFRRSVGVPCCDISDWKRCRKSITNPPRSISCEVIIFSASALSRFPVLYLQKRNDSRMNGMSVSLYCLVLILCSDKHPKVRFILTFVMTTNEKTWVLNFCLFDIRGLRKPIAVNRQRNTHAGEYSTLVKCALRLH
jgi:hypothetical protein